QTCSPGRLRPGLRAKRAMMTFGPRGICGGSDTADTLASLAGRTKVSAPTRTLVTTSNPFCVTLDVHAFDCRIQGGTRRLFPSGIPSLPDCAISDCVRRRDAGGCRRLAGLRDYKAAPRSWIR